MVQAHGAELCTESFGQATDPPILLIMGVGGSMIWWDEEFCRMLAGGGRFVVRYDHRDTGRSTTYPVGRPGYGGSDLLADIVVLLDAYDLAAAHVVGVSAGGGFAQELALAHPERVLSLVLISTTFATATDRTLPGPTEEFGDFVATAGVDWSDDDSVVEYMVGYQRLLAGGERPFDEPAVRELVRRDVARARDYSAVQNHDTIAGDGGDHPPVSSIAVPALVIHGTADPMFPLEHGEALAEAIPGARLISLDGAGHGVWRDDWEAVSRAILAHTAG
jgi:pimeloyl-ACP methyl ester carboxylesterase